MFHRSILATIVLLFAEYLQAQVLVTNPEERVWTDKTGKHQVTARLIEIKGREIRLKRSDNQKEVTMTLTKLSPDDVKYIGEVKEKERQIASLLREQDSFEELRKLIDPLIDRCNELGPPKETSVQAERRKSQRLKDLDKGLANQSFTLFLEAADVRQARIDDGMLSIADPANAGNRAAARKMTFDIEIKQKEYPIPIPKTFRVYAGAASELKIGSFFCLKCKILSQDPEIGSFKLEYRNFRFPVAIIEFIVPPSSMPESPFTGLKNSAPKPEEPKLDPLKITRESFRNAFYGLDGANKMAFSVVSKEDVLTAFGPAHRTRNIDSSQFLTYQCQDGIVVLVVQANAEAVIPDGHMLIISIEDY